MPIFVQIMSGNFLINFGGKLWINIGQKLGLGINFGHNWDKSWVIRTNHSQIPDRDIYETYLGHMLDIFWHGTKVGQKLVDPHCQPAPDFDVKYDRCMLIA